MPHSTITVNGANLIAGVASHEGTETFYACDPSTGADLAPGFHEATTEEVARATTAAHDAYLEYRTWSGERIAHLLRAISEEIMGLGDVLLETAQSETGLPAEPRLAGERARACAQFEMFAQLVASGEHLGVIIDHSDNSVAPPRPDLRRTKLPVGPVAVFGASNFPLAFSVPGGDTASALAAGCPVVIKGHPSHPATSELCSRALVRAVEQVDGPAGLVNLLQGRSHGVGQALVLAKEIRAVGFTGSLRGGKALSQLAASRDHPIPVHAEMGSLNPVLVTTRALKARGTEIASQLVGSLTTGVGQFCTSPGLVFVPHGEAGDRFVDALATELSQVPAAPLLNRGISDGLTEQLRGTMQVAGVTTLLEGTASGEGGITCSPTLLSVDFDTYAANERIRQEHFGPASIVVRCPDGAWDRVVEHLDGQLTLTLQAEDDDAEALRQLRADANEIAGRILYNDFPTGVAVTAAQHHGGPYPAASDPRFTSVGATSIERFLRPVAYQNFPETLLPDELLDANPLGIPRRVDGTPQV